eukprot:1506624-Pyramimonas_sp.AAC.1
MFVQCSLILPAPPGPAGWRPHPDGVRAGEVPGRRVLQPRAADALTPRDLRFGWHRAALPADPHSVWGPEVQAEHGSDH